MVAGEKLAEAIFCKSTVAILVAVGTITVSPSCKNTSWLISPDCNSSQRLIFVVCTPVLVMRWISIWRISAILVIPPAVCNARVTVGKLILTAAVAVFPELVLVVSVPLASEVKE